jgi:segregation and condensation protein A
MTEEALRVSLPVFEGPMDLLLYLVKKEEVDIYDIEITKVANQYLDFLGQMEEMNMEVAGDFLVMAANLIYLKSRMLLPPSEQALDLEDEGEDLKWDLIRQLVEYKKFKEASQDLQDKEERQVNVFSRRNLPEFVSDEKPGVGKVGMVDLIQAFQRVLTRLEERRGLNDIHEDEFTVSQKIDYLLEHVRPEKAAKFTELFGELASRNEIVVTFLALLELIRLKQLRVRQTNFFEDIEIERA